MEGKTKGETLQRNIEAEKGAAFHLVSTPEESLTSMLNQGFTADCFTIKPFQILFGCIVECAGRGITERRGIASELQNCDLNPNDILKLQRWLALPPSPEIKLDRATRTLIDVRAWNQAQEMTVAFFKTTKPQHVKRNLPGLIDTLLHINTRTVAADALPSNILDQEGASDYISTGYDKLDDLLKPPYYSGHGGLGLGQLSVLGMPSNHGKSTFGCNLACNFIRQGVGVIFFSMEMGSKRVLLWLLSNLAYMPISAILNPSGKEEVENLEATKKLADAWLRMYSGHHTISGMSARIRAHQREFGPIGLVIIDRFRTIKDEAEWSRRSGWDLLDAKANALLQLAQETGSHIFTLNQMTEVAKANWENGMQVKSDRLLRGGQSLYNAADTVLAGGRHIGHDNNIYDPAKETITRLHIKKTRDKGPDPGIIEWEFNSIYKHLKEI